MITINHVFKAVSPLHTGADQVFGTMKSLRRQKVVCDPPVKVKSNLSVKQRRDCVVEIMYAVHMSLDKSDKRMTLWEEWHSKILRAATAQSKTTFFQNICKYWDVRDITDDALKKVDLTGCLDLISSEELLFTVRNESAYLVLLLKARTQKDSVQPSLFAKKEETVEEFAINYFEVPCFSGNSIRGAMRDRLMYDFLNLAGITSLRDDMYHQLFTGGALNESSQYNDIAKREELINNCPPLGVLGAAIGDMIIAGNLSVGFAYPVCKEIGSGEKSYWEYLDVVFQTRFDDSKSEGIIDIISNGKKENPTQMKYEYEVFMPGTMFSHSFKMNDENPLFVSCFYRMMELFVKNPFIGGMWATGSSVIDLQELSKQIPEGASDLYLMYMQENKDKIASFFNSKR